MTRLSIQRPLTVLMGILALVLLGGVAYSYLKVDRLPPLSFPVVFVDVIYPQAAAQDVEQLVTKPIEDALAGVPGAVVITSTSSEGRSRVRLQLADGVNPDLAALDVERRIARIRGRLPIDAQEPIIRKADPSEQPIMNVALTGAPLDQLFDIANEQLSPALQSVRGVGAVNISGGLQREIQVRVDYGKLAARNLSVAQVSTALTNANVTSTVGSSEQGGQLLNLRAIGRFETPAQLENLVVAQTPTGTILLRDVATVQEGYKRVTQVQRLNGEDAVGLSVVKVSEANALQVADDVRAVLDRFEPTLPPGGRIEVRNDTSIFTRASLHAIQFDLILAILIVGLITLLFLHQWKNVVIIVLSIPTSMISTFLIMYALGFTLNLMTLMALALMVGILVDASIVVIENIHRHLLLGETPRDAALKGRNEIAMATVAIAAADVVVYIPIAFMTGFVGQLFRQYGLTIVAATLFSLLISFTLTPMLASRWLTRESHETGPLARFGRWWDARFDRISALVGRGVRKAVGARWAVAAAGSVLVALCVVMIQTRAVGSEYAPVEDDGSFVVSLRTPAGTSLEATEKAAREMEEALLAMHEVHSVFTTVSVAGAGFQAGSGGRAILSVQLVPRHERSRSSLDVIQQARQIGRRIPGATVSARPNSSLPGGASTGRLDVNVSGPDMDTLVQVVAQVKAALAEIPGFTDVEDSGTEGTPELLIVLDGTRMAQLNVTTQVAVDALRTTLGGRVVSVLRPTGKPQQDITVIAHDVDRSNLTQLAAIPVRGGSNLNVGQNIQPLVTLGQVATITYGTGPVEIQRTDRNRTIEVGGTVVGRSLGDVAADLRTTLASLEMPPGYSVQTGRQVNRFNEALVGLLQALTLALILEYMLLVALYQSWMQPLVLLLSVPLGLVGSIVGLFVTGNTINIFSLMGMIMAFGLVAKNGILLIDFTNLLRERGLDRTEALVEAARTRLRPILMTSAVMVCGMFPLALKLEEGAESRSPMAVVVIGAILTSTALAVFVIPAVYTLLDDLQVFLARRRLAVARPTAAPVPAAAMAFNRATNGRNAAQAVAANAHGVGNGVPAAASAGPHDAAHEPGPSPAEIQRPVPSRQS